MDRIRQIMTGPGEKYSDLIPDWIYSSIFYTNIVCCIKQKTFMLPTAVTGGSITLVTHFCVPCRSTLSVRRLQAPAHQQAHQQRESHLVRGHLCLDPREYILITKKTKHGEILRQAKAGQDPTAMHTHTHIRRTNPRG